MHILMLETRQGSEHARGAQCFQHGRVYDVAQSFARAFIRAGYAIAWPIN